MKQKGNRTEGSFGERGATWNGRSLPGNCRWCEEPAPPLSPVSLCPSVNLWEGLSISLGHVLGHFD